MRSAREHGAVMGQYALPHVLLVEDEPLTREHLAEEFHEAGWSVLEASSAEQALALCQKHQSVEAAIIDIQLAGNMTGLELANIMHAMGHTGPVVYVSGGPVDRRRMLCGSVFMPKPVNPPDVIRATERLMRSASRFICWIRLAKPFDELLLQIYCQPLLGISKCGIPCSLQALVEYQFHRMQHFG